MLDINFNFIKDCFSTYGNHAYGSMLQLGNKGLLYYREGHGKEEKIVYRVTYDGINFSETKEPLLFCGNKKQETRSDIRVSHNFSPFKDVKNNTIKAIGGRYGLGFYFSEDGIKWHLQKKIRLKTFKAKLNTDMTFKTIGHKKNKHFDAFSSCVFNNNLNEYILLHRLNLKKGARYIQVFKSKDFLNWSNPLFFNIKGKEFTFKKDSYYFGLIYKIYNSYICLSPYINYINKKACVRILNSNDIVNWKILKDIFITEMTPRTNKKRESTHKNPIHPINGYYEKDNGDILFYFQDNYYNIDKKRPVVFKAYKINKINKNYKIIIKNKKRYR